MILLKDIGFRDEWRPLIHGPITSPLTNSPHQQFYINCTNVQWILIFAYGK